MNMFIQKSKLRAPRVGKTVAREVLVNKVMDNSFKRLVMINAAAGYGKTTFLAQLYAALPGVNIWYQIDQNDSDFSYIFAHLVEAIRERVPHFGISGKSFSNGEPMEGVLTSFINHVSNELDEPLLLFFDDFHLLKEETETRKALQFLLTHLPPQCCIFLVGREKAALSVAKMRIQKKLMEFKEADLSFSLEETSAYLCRSSKMPVLPSQIRKIYEQTMGWPIGVVLFQKSLERAGLPGEKAKTIMTSLELDRYLNDEVWSQLNPEFKELFLQSSFSQTIDPIICDELLQPPTSTSRLWRMAFDQNLMIFSLGQGHLYRFHPAFKEFLQARFLEARGKAKRRVLNERYAAIYKDHGRIDDEIYHLIEAEDYTKAAEEIELIGTEYLTTGRSEAVRSWLDQFPAATIRQRGWFQYYRAFLDLKNSRIASGLRNASAAQKLFRESNNNRGVYQGALLEGELYATKTEHKKSLRAYTKALQAAEKDSEKIEALGRIAVQYLILGDTEKALGLWDEALKLCTGGMDSVRQMISVSRMNAFYFMGDFKQMLRDTDLLLADDNLYKNSFNFLSVLFYRILVTFESAKYSESLKWIAAARSYSDNFKGYDLAFKALEGQNLLYAGEPSKGQRIIETIYGVKSEHKMLGPDSTLNYLGAWQRQNGASGEALVSHEKSLAMSLKEEKPYAIASSLMNLAFDRLKQAPLADDLSHSQLQESLSIAKKGHYSYLVAQISFFYAWIAFNRQELSVAKREIKKSLVLSAENGYDHFVINEGASSLPLLIFAFEHNISRDYLTNIFAKIGPDAVKALFKFVDSANANLKRATITCLAAAATPDAVGVIRRLMRDPDAEVKTFAENALLQIRASVTNPQDVLSQREFSVFSKIGKGLSNGEIAEALFISEATVKTYVSRIFNKLGLSKRGQVASFFHQKTDDGPPLPRSNQ